jgi:hypothetical protein
VETPPRGLRQPSWLRSDVDGRWQVLSRQEITATAFVLCLYAAMAAGVALLVARVAATLTHPGPGGAVTYVSTVVGTVVAAGLLAPRILGWLFGRIR